MAVPGGDVFFLTITELSAKLRAKEFSAQELTRAYLDRLEKLGPTFNALAHSLRERAIKKAKDVDSDLKIGRTRGMLQGIPFGAKDLFAAQGQPTEWGSKMFAGQKFDEDARVIQKLDRVGAVLIGKLAMIEIAGGIGYRTAAASVTGATTNPWDKTKWAGGSSSGSAAAVAAGLVTFALGSETSGSIVTPAAFCGVTGLRPTYGLVSRKGAMALSWSLDKVGVLCRSVEDCGLVLEQIAGADNDDAGSARKGFRYLPQLDRPISELTLGFVPAHFEQAVPEARATLQAGFEAVKALGAKIREVQIPEFPFGAVLETILGGEAASAFEDMILSGKVDLMADENQAASLKAAIEISAVDYLKAQRVRSLVKAAFRELFFDVDVLVAPARSGVAPAAGVLGGGGGPSDSLIPATNLVGYPGLSVPCGFASGLPVAIAFMGKPFYENQVLSFGRAFQAATDWHKRRPAIA